MQRELVVESRRLARRAPRARHAVPAVIAVLLFAFAEALLANPEPPDPLGSSNIDLMIWCARVRPGDPTPEGLVEGAFEACAMEESTLALCSPAGTGDAFACIRRVDPQPTESSGPLNCGGARDAELKIKAGVTLVPYLITATSDINGTLQLRYKRSKERTCRVEALNESAAGGTYVAKEADELWAQVMFQLDADATVSVVGVTGEVTIKALCPWRKQGAGRGVKIVNTGSCFKESGS